MSVRSPKVPRTKVMRPFDWSFPPSPATRDVRSVLPVGQPGRPPLLFVHGFAQGSWCFAEHWMEYAADRGFPAYAVSLRGHEGSSGGQRRRRITMREYVHDVVQAAAGLPRQAILVGHGLGGLVVARALSRYPARAGVLVAPVLHGWASVGAALRSAPLHTLPALFGGRLRLRHQQLFSGELPTEVAREYLSRLEPQAPLVRYQALWHRAPEPPLAGAPVLVVGSPHDRLVPGRALERVARRYGGEPLLFPGMGHNLMLDARWKEPIEAILEWLDTELASRQRPTSAALTTTP